MFPYISDVSHSESERQNLFAEGIISILAKTRLFVVGLSD